MLRFRGVRRKQILAGLLAVCLCAAMIVDLGSLLLRSESVSALGTEGDGVLVYGASGSSNPQSRLYTSSSNSFGTASNTVAGTIPLTTVTKTSPTKQEAVAGYVNASGVLQVMCFDSVTSAWTNDWTVTVGGTGTSRRFDIAYEKTTGNAVVVYGNNGAGLAYRTKSGSLACGSGNWAAATTFTPARTTGTISWVRVSADNRASSNLISVAWADSNSDLSTAIWSGSALANEPAAALATTLEFATAAQDVDNFEITYESTSGDVMVVWGIFGTGTTNLIKYATCTGGTSTCTWTLNLNVPTVADAATHIDLGGDPLSDQIGLAAVDNGSNDLSAAYWTGSAWTGYANLDITTELPAVSDRVVSVGWLTNGSATRWFLNYDNDTGTGLSWYAATPGSTPTVQTVFAASPAINDVRRRYALAIDPFNRSLAMFTLTDTTGALFAKRAALDGSGNFTWTNADGGASLGTVAQATVQDFSYAYWQVVTPQFEQSAYRWYNNTESAITPWWNGSWFTRRVVTFNNAASTENLVDFAVRVSLTSSNIDYAKTQNAGQDIRFVDSDGTTQLSHEIETWNEAGTSEVWVKVPQINLGSTTDFIYMYYNNTGASDGQSASNVWSSSHRAVMHHKESSGSSTADSTSNANTGTLTNGAAFTAGKIGNAINYDGVNDFTTMGSGTSLDDLRLQGGGGMTIEAWVNPDLMPAGTWGEVAIKAQNSNPTNGWLFEVSGDSDNVLGLHTGSAGSQILKSSLTDTIIAGQWQYLVFTFDGGLLYDGMSLYRNGQLMSFAGFSNGAGPLASDAAYAFTSACDSVPTANNCLDGKVDELRASNVIRSAEWIEAQYASMNNTMNTFAAEENSTSVVPLTSADNLATTLETVGENYFRMRIALHISGGKLTPANANLKLQAAPRSGTCDTAFVGESAQYADVTQASGPVRYLNNAAKIDGQAMTPAAAPIHAGHNSVPQTYEELNNFAAITTTPIGSDAIWEFALDNQSIEWNTSQCFRVVYASGTALEAYTIIPEVTVCNNPPQSAQLRHGQAHCGSVNKRKFFW